MKGFQTVEMNGGGFRPFSHLHTQVWWWKYQEHRLESSQIDRASGRLKELELLPGGSGSCFTQLFGKVTLGEWRFQLKV